MRKLLFRIGFTRQIFLAFSILFVLGLASTAQAERIQLVAALTDEINKVLSGSDRLHNAMITQDEDQLEIATRELIWQIQHTKKVSLLAKDHERGHLLRILDAALNHLDLVQSSYGEERQTHLADAFNQLVNLLRVYHLDSRYSIYFCPKDKTTWVQAGVHGVNPFRAPASQNLPACGIRVTDPR